GVAFDPSLSTLRMGAPGEEMLVFANGTPVAYEPAAVSAALGGGEVSLILDLTGEDAARIFGCDLGYGYVRINAEYHT
ncbi:MAG: ornithine acetyltransferase, partial [Armatimonadota bacterium]